MKLRPAGRTIGTFHDYDELLDKMRIEIDRTLGEHGGRGSKP
jgi:hypothetical protein